MDIAALIGKRMDEVRRAHGISINDLSEMLGVTRQTVTNYLNGKQVIDSEKLAKIARAFNKSLDYFLELEESNPLSLMYRAEYFVNDSEDSIQYILSRFQRYAEVLSLAGQKPAFVPESYNLALGGKKCLAEGDKALIEQIAIKQRQSFGVDGISGASLWYALEDSVLNIISFPLKADIWGMSAYSQQLGTFIFVNDRKDIPEERKIFSLLHEVGHLLLDKNRYTNDNADLRYSNRRADVFEKAADFFAGCFLVPRPRLAGDLQLTNNMNFQSLLALKKKYGISIQSLLVALQNYGFISRNSQAHLFAILNKEGYSKREPQPMKAFVKNKQLMFTLNQLYLNDEIGVSKIAEVLDIPLPAARKMVAEWGDQD